MDAKPKEKNVKNASLIFQHFDVIAMAETEEGMHSCIRWKESMQWNLKSLFAMLRNSRLFIIMKKWS
jgi:hypothetical protein